MYDAHVGHVALIQAQSEFYMFINQDISAKFLLSRVFLNTTLYSRTHFFGAMYDVSADAYLQLKECVVQK